MVSGEGGILRTVVELLFFISLDFGPNLFLVHCEYNRRTYVSGPSLNKPDCEYYPGCYSAAFCHFDGHLLRIHFPNGIQRRGASRQPALELGHLRRNDGAVGVDEQVRADVDAIARGAKCQSVVPLISRRRTLATAGKWDTALARGEERLLCKRSPSAPAR